MHLTREAAAADVAQLVALLAESHPDPYSAMGGPIGYHRRARAVTEAIPADGISDDDLLRLLRPFVAAMRDGHSRIDVNAPPGQHIARPWVEWDVVEQELYVSAVYRPEDAPLFGARLRALEGVPFAELRACMEGIRGFDNEYHSLLHLADALVDPPMLAELLEWHDQPAVTRESLALTVLTSQGETATVNIPCGDTAPGQRIVPPTALQLPPLTAAQMAWSFVDDRRRVGYLRVDSLMSYREAFEYSIAVGSLAQMEQALNETARLALGGDKLPDDPKARVELVPSATELLHRLFATMRAASTPHLLVDLRYSPGGSSIFALILEYFLYGIEASVTLDEGYQVKRYSSLYLANRLATTREELEPFLRNGGYDFSEEDEWRRVQAHGLTAVERQQRVEDVVALGDKMPSLGRLLSTRQAEALWTPHVIVLTGARTYSAGFDIAAMLVKHGASVVGVPSAQAGNCFIDILPYTLTNSGLKGIVSFKWSRAFPEDEARGKVLRPAHELTYAELAGRNFDPNATVALAMEDIAPHG